MGAIPELTLRLRSGQAHWANVFRVSSDRGARSADGAEFVVAGLKTGHYKWNRSGPTLCERRIRWAISTLSK